MNLSTKQDFIKRLDQYESHPRQQYIGGHFRFESDYNDPFTLVDDENFRYRSFTAVYFMSLHFKNCHFSDCNFSDVAWASAYLENCTFTNSVFSNCEFYESQMRDCEFINCTTSIFLCIDSSLLDIKFKSCLKISELTLTNCQCNLIQFQSCSLFNVHFSRLLKLGRSKNFSFKSCELFNCNFANIDLKKCTFESNILKSNVFINCFINSTTFSQSNKCKGGEYSSIDLHTLSKSEVIGETILQNIFGITEPDIKGFAEGLVKKVTFQSVFISYSFKDRFFAHALNDLLRAKGAITFLWEKDAPGGQRLKKIMSENVRKMDRILFISSIDSLKSAACQFELTEGRKKQNLNWSTVFFPIHIDNYLFEVEEDDIKPNDMRKEYWSNILELREINSLDFSKFNTQSFDQQKFNSIVTKLIASLRK
ncbi:MAG: pentapeptide repeat-containing protein [Ferruginibacter sp.]